MLRFTKKALGKQTMVVYPNGKKILTYISNNIDQHQRQRILNAGYAHLFANPSDYVIKTEKPKPVPARIVIEKEGKKAEELKTKLIKAKLLKTDALDMSFGELSKYSLTDLEGKFSVSELNLIAQRLNKLKDVNIKFNKLPKEELLKEINSALEKV